MINFIKYAMVLANKTSNIIRKHLILAYFTKYADLISDLKSIKQFEKYFVTEEEALKNIEKLLKQEKPIRPEDGDWYMQTGDMEHFYVYQDSPLGVTDVLYGECFLADFKRRGYDDYVCLAGVYPVDDKGNINGKIMGYKTMKGKTLSGGVNEIQNTGIRGYGRLYIAGTNDVYHDYFELKKYVTKQLEERDKNLKIK